ncbi:hypothetical protein [Polyangium sp. y55x31]|uniref:hypothetical protein n=1 Tax=Polyangium sp. y55x31 TaxID=3042688 RepID=UPI0024825655|nr:hypothetical protein [Polyangium sp. y55x31]MDI1483827.1 hypothetical protein [Polyangium sp. y55x31]
MPRAEPLFCAALLATMLGALAGCAKPPETVYLVAVGARDDMPKARGACRIAEARPSAPIRFDPAGQTYEAVDPGRVQIPCEQGVVVLDVRRPSRVRVDTTQAAKRGDLLVMELLAFDDAGTRLSLGRAPIAWSFTGALGPRRPPACTGTETACAPENAGYAVAFDEGEGQVLARFGGLSSRIVVTVSP